MFGANYSDSILDYSLNKFTWQPAVSLWPRRCYFTKDRVWLSAVRGTRLWTGPGEPIVEQIWTTRKHYMILKLTGTV